MKKPNSQVIKNLKEENQRLNKLVGLSTIQIKAKSLELKIQSSLEIIRKVAMSMSHPEDMLNICQSISKELRKFGVAEIRNVQTAVFYASRGTYMNYEYYSKHHKTFITDTLYTNHKLAKVFAHKMMSGKGEFFATHIKGKKVKEWLAYQKTTNVFIDKFLEKASSLNYYWHSLGPVALGISTYAPLSKIDLDLFRRFLQVFELAYTRYLDIEQAMAQAKEARIEASLEKMRTAAMTMQKADDLLSVCETLFKQFNLLGFQGLRNAMINIHDDAKKIFINYDYSDFIGKSTNLLSYNTHPVIEKQVGQMRKATDAFSETVFKGKDLSDWKIFRKKIGEKDDPRLKNAKALYYYFYSIGTGSIGISCFNPIKDDQLQLLKRFRNVFSLSYQRYSDIALAEAQAREAKIEAALERIRARALAMHSSDELIEVAKVLREQMGLLGQPELETSAVQLYEEDPENILSWRAFRLGSAKRGEISYSRISIPKHCCALVEEMLEKFYTKENNYTVEVSGAKQAAWYKVLIRIAPDFHKAMKESNSLTEKRYYHFSKFSGGALLMVASQHPSSESIYLQKRSADVFDLAYRRFLDLKKAEAQAREAQIEVALERVRSRSMGMQKSEELKEVIKIVYQQLKLLKINLDHAGFVVDYTPGGEWHFWIADENDIPSKITHPYFKSVWASQFNEAKEKGKDLFTTHLNFEEKNKFYRELLSHIPWIPEASRDFYLGCPGLAATTVLFENVSLYIENFSGIPYTPDENNILLRFGKVFQQTYTRFLDLQKAEAQAREAQIELGLERVRARAMAMQHSNELSQLVDTVFKELANLDFALNWCIINIIDEPSLANMVWAASPETNKPPESYLMKFEDYPFHHSMMKGYRDRKQQYVYVLEGKEKKEYDKYLFNKTEWRRVPKKAQAASRAMKRYVASFTFSNFGGLQTVGEEPLSTENLDILSRFGKVFDLTYTRFNDLQKAEAQAREAQIELSLERVRARTMAMQHSNDLADTASVLFQQIKEIGFDTWSCGFCTWQENDMVEVWMGAGAGGLLPPMMIPYKKEPTHRDIYNASLKGEEVHQKVWKGKALDEHYSFLRTMPSVATAIKQLEEAGLSLPAIQCYYAGFFKQGYLLLITKEANEALPEITKRFAKVFEQAYTRFLDLQKAEAQAREAQIEAALERTRTQSMIMQHSNELDDTLRVFHEQVQLLGIYSAFSFLWLPDEGKDKHIFWAIWEEIKNGVAVFKNKAISYPLDRNEPSTKQCLIDWKGDEPVVSYEVPPEGVENYFAAWQELIEGVEKLTAPYFPHGLYYVEAFMKYGCFGVLMEKDLNEDEKKILVRIAVEFERTYTRFLDLQKAEAQAREAQIEAALERVRSQSMAMQSSKDLSNVTTAMFEQLRMLGGELYATGIVFCDKLPGHVEQWHSVPGAGMLSPFIVPVDLDYIHQYRYDQWKKGVELFSVEIPGDFIAQHFDSIFQLPTVKAVLEDFATKNIPMPETPSWEVDYGASFKYGYILVSALQPFTDAAILPRFATVFEQTYTRFLDLQKAEAQAKEAQIEAGLERVRSRTLAMQSSNELAETAAVLFKQLINLGIAPNRLYIGIIKEETRHIECWVTDEDGSKVSTQFLGDTKRNISLHKMYEGWKKQSKSLIIDMKGKELEDYFHYLADELHVPFKDGLSQTRRIQTIAYFSKGFIGMASPVDQPEGTTLLLERFAGVFNLTFTRFNDLKIAEAHALQAEEDLIAIKEAKQKAEQALVELQVTQRQLVQSEKMASLGELTAGIAHEIQNPLNFVNNFSEVSKELLDEMKTELNKGNIEDAKEIMEDVIQNLEKINHHGKRADGIVKGMLQHSRSSSGVKEPTDINALADEYLRLCFHGLRAKDKSFNATFKTDFDESIGKINIISQDIGRVLLNLLANAFYVVNEKKQTNITGYEPTVIISTKKSGDKVEIRVIDNGNGIPKKVQDKIFQPFFTTKPTGQGTGLGLSLSYDIVKVHGGELKVDTLENVGTTFIILLPVVNS